MRLWRWSPMPITNASSFATSRQPPLKSPGMWCTRSIQGTTTAKTTTTMGRESRSSSINSKYRSIKTSRYFQSLSKNSMGKSLTTIIWYSSKRGTCTQFSSLCRIATHRHPLSSRFERGRTGKRLSNGRKS